MNISVFDNLDDAFRVDGEAMRVHRGRSVVRVEVDGCTHYLKRFWFTPGQVFRRFVAQGLHELAMIDWLNAGGFTGPMVVARGLERRYGMRWRMFFLMREVPGEIPLERYWRRNRDEADALIGALAEHTARLHDAGFHHHDYSERHLLVSRRNGAFRFRQIDLERAGLASPNDTAAAADIKTLAASIAAEELRQCIEGPFVDRYLAARKSGSTAERFKDLLAAAKPTKSFG